MSMRTPPAGIIVLSFLGILGALWSIVQGLGMAAYGPLGAVLGPIVILLGVGQLLVSIGLLSLNSVAWILAMGLYALSFVLHLSNLSIVSLLITGLILAYLFSKRSMYFSSNRNVGTAHGLR